MSYDFTGKTALVTGAGHGFGRAIAKALAALGAQVLAIDVDEAEFEETRAEAGERCRVQRIDVTDRAAVQALVAETEGRGGVARPRPHELK
jgi:3-oxoacyl-[acyl-carrier protein] reductase